MRQFMTRVEPAGEIPQREMAWAEGLCRTSPARTCVDSGYSSAIQFGFLGVSRCQQSVAFALQELVDTAADGMVVVCDTAERSGPAIAPMLFRVQTEGRRISKVVPWPTLLSALI